MAETAAISKMAEILSDDIFSVFKWSKTGPINVNWECVNKKNHNNRDSHPSDVVFYYDEPYTTSRSYVNLDLKSYADGSIKTTNINTAVHNLIQSVECTNSSEEWQKLYVHDGVNFLVHGLLFIYNHDGGYDSDFHKLMTKCELNTDKLPSKSTIGIWGPNKVNYLNTVANDIEVSLGRLKADNYEFFYPDLSKTVKIEESWKAAATFEMLSSPMILLKYQNSNESGLIIYYSRKGESREEYIFLIEYLFHFQVFQNFTKIYLKLPEASKNASAQFSKAKEQYVNDSGISEDILLKKLSILEFSSIKNITTRFSEIEIGMRDA